MNHGASTKARSIAVMVAMMVRNGMYRRTLSHPSQSESCRSGKSSS